jgi:Rrf2 family protein
VNALNYRFALALHVLIYLHIFGEKGPVSSAVIASSVNTGRPYVRKSFQLLHRAGLTRGQKGGGGGAQLAKPAERISLRDVYRAVNGGGDNFGLPKNPDPTCVVGRNIVPVLTDLFSQVEEAIGAHLALLSVADVARDIQERRQRE